MSQLNVYPLPYTVPRPLPELFRAIETESGRSDTTAFDAGLDTKRDVFLGESRVKDDGLPMMAWEGRRP